MSHERHDIQILRGLAEPYAEAAAQPIQEERRELWRRHNSIPNLRIIAVTPSADLAACAEQIGTDYVISGRPSPTDMVCAGLDEERVCRVIGRGLEVTRGCSMHVQLKNVETVEGEHDRLARWVQIVRETIDRYL